MSKTKILGLIVISLGVVFTTSLAQAATDTEALQPAAPGEAVKIGDLGRYFDEYSSYMQLDTALHSSETAWFPDVHIGSQGLGGVTFFNGTIVNETTDNNGGNLPVTFGDRVRIDDFIYRNAPGAADKMPVLIGDGLSPALDDVNSLGEPSRRWQYLHVSDNIYGENIIHEDNLSVTNSPSANQVLAYAGNNRFKWIDELGSIESSEGSGDTIEEGDVIVREEDTWVAGDLDDLLSTLDCSDNQFIQYDAATTTWVCTDIDEAVVDGAFDGTSRELRFETGITNVVPACAAGTGYTPGNAIHDDFRTAFTNDNTYSITATYYTGGQPSQAQQSSVYPIDIVKDPDNNGFTAYTCFPDQTAIMWQAIGY